MRKLDREDNTENREEFWKLIRKFNREDLAETVMRLRVGYYNNKSVFYKLIKQLQRAKVNSELV